MLTEDGIMETLNVNSLIDLSEEVAIEKIKRAGMQARIRNRDEQAFMGTCDYRIDRVNLIIKNNLVVSASIG
jgi:hypothetical protein